jgi:hypothetical protein
MVHLKRLGRLTRLSLEQTVIDDKGIGELKQLKCLEELRLRETSVTDDGANELEKALPAIKITRSSRPIFILARP